MDSQFLTKNDKEITKDLLFFKVGSHLSKFYGARISVFVNTVVPLFIRSFLPKATPSYIIRPATLTKGYPPLILSGQPLLPKATPSYIIRPATPTKGYPPLILSGQPPLPKASGQPLLPKATLPLYYQARFQMLRDNKNTTKNNSTFSLQNLMGLAY
jgi:hypothetical protein